MRWPGYSSHWLLAPVPGFLGHDPTLQRYRLTSVAVNVTKSKNERQEPDVLAGRMDGWEKLSSVRDDLRVSALVD
jgi:hypothetical protein